MTRPPRARLTRLGALLLWPAAAHTMQRGTDARFRPEKREEANWPARDRPLLSGRR